MFSHTIARLRRVPWERVSQTALLILLTCAILWRGGRTLEMTLLLGMVACAVVLFGSRHSRASERTVPPLVWWLTAAFVVWTALSYILTSTMNYGFDEVVQTASLALLFVWMIRLPAEAKVRTSVLRVMTVAVLLACLVGVLVYTMGPVNRFVGTFLDVRAPWKSAWPNAWAELLLLAWPVALLLSRPYNEQGRGAVETFLKILKRSTPTGVMVGCLFLSFSRAAFLAFLGQGILLLLWAVLRRLSWRRTAAVAVGSLLIGIVFFGLANHLRSRTHAVQSLSERTLFLAPEGTSSVSERKSFWRQATALSLERPVFGWGPGSFRFAQTSLMQDVFATSDHAHNVFLKAAQERGWPAALLLLALACVLFVPLLKGIVPPGCRPQGACPFLCVCARIPRRELSARDVLLLTALLGVLAHNLVDYNLQFIAISLPAVLILGMLVTPGARPMNKKIVRSAEFALAVILLAAILREGFFAVTSTVARRADARGNVGQALQWYRWSAGEWYSRDLPLSLTRLQMRAGAPDAALREIRRYTEVTNPMDARGWVLQAEVAAVARQSALAEASYERAYALTVHGSRFCMAGFRTCPQRAQRSCDRKREISVPCVLRCHSPQQSLCRLTSRGEFVSVADIRPRSTDERPAIRSWRWADSSGQTEIKTGATTGESSW